MKAFNIDYNWSFQGDRYKSAVPGTFCNANPQKIIDWYKWIGADSFWTFATTYNGYAWYDSKFAKMTPGLNRDFLSETTLLGKKNNMKVFAYACVTANPWWEELYPETVRPEEGELMKLVPTEKYLEHLSNVLVESAYRADFDGLALDWFRHPSNKRQTWITCEKELYKKLTGENFPKNSLPDDVTTAMYDKKMIEYMWDYIAPKIRAVRPLEIWANEPFKHGEDLVWENNRFLQEINYTLNESFDLSFIPLIKKFAPNIKVIQNICGWEQHKVENMNLEDYDFDGLFGFAQADEDTCMPEKGENSKSNSELMKVNYKNILKIKEMFLK